MIQLTFTVTYANGNKAEVTTRPMTDLAFEREFGVSIVKMFVNYPRTADEGVALKWLAEEVKASEVYFLAWHASRTELPLEAWLETVAGIGWKEAADVDPTHPARSAGSSPSSRSRSGNPRKSSRNGKRVTS